jgi:hypothetical protein
MTKQRCVAFLIVVLLVTGALQSGAEEKYLITTVAGNKNGGTSADGVPATEAGLDLTWGQDICLDGSGNLYIAETKKNRIRKVDSSGIITTIAGNGVAGFSGDGGPATKASLNWPCNIALDAAGNLYISDNENNRIRKVDSSGIITTIAGTGKRNSSGDGGPAARAELAGVGPIRLDPAGNVYVVEWYADWSVEPYKAFGHRIRKIDTSGIITTFAGTGVPGYSGDGGPAVKATMNEPVDLWIDPQGNLYFADLGNNRVRKIDPSGIITTFAGNGNKWDGSPADKALLFGPGGVCVDTEGNVYIAESMSDQIRKVDVSGIISTIAGTGMRDITGDGGPALQAKIGLPVNIRPAPDGSLYFIDPLGSTVRKLYR